MDTRILRKKREDILRIAAQHGARNIRVFGSVARGQAADDSDLDLLVELDPNRSLLDLIRLEGALTQLLGCKVQVISQRGLKPRARDRILDEAKAV
jgi:uncharacterized protein